MARLTQGYGLLAFCTLVWGLNYPASKILLAHFSPFWLSEIRMTTAALVLFALAHRQRERLRPTRRELLFLAGSGVLGTGANSLFFYQGLHLTTPTKASLVMALLPLATTLFLALTGQEKVTGRHAAGATLALGGVALVLLPGQGLNAVLRHDPGDAYIFLAMLTGAANGLFLKVALRTLGATASAAWALGLGALSVLPIVGREPVGNVVVDIRLIALFLYAAVVAMALAGVAWNRAMHQLGVGVSTLFFNVIPLVALLSDHFFFGAKLTATSWAGFLLTLSGLMIALLQLPKPRWRPRKRKLTPAPGLSG